MISVIVPVYNAGEYLTPCLESIAGQSYRNLEIIVADDGSTDGSGPVCDGFAARDPRFRVIHQANGGVSSARNAALDAATGDYLFFMDADDTLHPRALEILLKTLRSGPYDIATGQFRRVEQPGRPVQEDIPAEHLQEVIPGSECMEHSIMGDCFRWAVVWNHLFPRSLSEGIRFEAINQEDRLYCFLLLQRVGQSVLTNETTYYYLEHPDSLSRQPGYLGEDSNFTIIRRMMDLSPKDSKERAWILKKMYRRYLTRRYHVHGSGPRNEDFEKVFRPILQQTWREYLAHPGIRLSEKLLFLFLYYCPWAVWIFMKATHN